MELKEGHIHKLKTPKTLLDTASERKRKFPDGIIKGYILVASIDKKKPSYLQETHC